MKAFCKKIVSTRAGKMVFAIVCCLLAVAVALGILIDRNIRPIALAAAEGHARSIASEALSGAVKACAQDVSYTDVVRVLYDERGRVSMLQADSAHMNRIAADAASTAQSYLARIGETEIGIPLGTLFGDPILAGFGPVTRIKVIPAGSVTSSFSTNFSAAGINQTRHEISLRLTADVSVVVPVGARDISVSVTVPIAESIIVGDVPRDYANIERTQDILPLIPREAQ